MPFTYVDNMPVPTNAPRVDVNQMNSNSQYLAEFALKDHNFTRNSTNSADGYHVVTHFVNQAADPANIAGVGQLYTKTSNGNQELFYKAGTSNVITQITPTAPIRAFVNFNTAGAIVGASYNVSSVTVVVIGAPAFTAYQVNFTNALPSANYLTFVSGRPTSQGIICGDVVFNVAPSTTQVTVSYGQIGGGAATPLSGYVMVLGG